MGRHITLTSVLHACFFYILRFWKLRPRSSGLDGVIKRQHRHGHFDVVFVQETHFAEAAISDVPRENVYSWGYQSEIRCLNISFWSAAPLRIAGVGILLHPSSLYTEDTPI